MSGLPPAVPEPDRSVRAEREPSESRAEASAHGRTGLARLFAGVENTVLASALALVALVPLSESLLRATLHVGISGSSAILQHLVLVVGMLGGAVAAREGRMLSLATADAFLKGSAKAFAHIASRAFAALIAVFLAVAGVQFVQLESESGATLAYGLPLWIVQAVIPLGFALVAVRMLWSAGETPKARVVATVALAVSFALVLSIGRLVPIDPSKLVAPGLVVLGMATLLGAPIFVTLGGAALILHWGEGSPISSISVDHYRLVTNPSLATLPLFTLAGYFFAEGGASKRLIRVFQTWFGGVRGGPAIVTTLVCAFFTSFTGASGVTILALGGLLMPILIEARYSERSALGLVTGAGSLGLLLPPCLPLILYAIIAKIPMETMFLGGILPGLVMMLLTAWWGIRQGPRIDRSRHGQRFDAREAWKALWIAKWELLLPVVALASLFGGFATPIEAAAITALYAFFVECFVYRDLSLSRGVPRVLVECGLLIGGVLLILGVALGFTNWLVDAEVPSKLLDAVTGSVQSPWLFLLLLNVFLLIVGGLMDIFSAIVVVVPLIVPLGEHYGIDPVHLGIVFLANLELGYLAPPVGMNLMIASYRFRKPMSQVYRAVVPMLVVLFVGVLLITYVPWMTTWLPRFFGH